MLTNSEVKLLSELKDRAGRRRQGRFLVEGKRSIAEAVAADARIEQIIVDAGVDSSRFAQVYSLAEQNGIGIVEVPSTKFRKLTSTENSQGIIAVAVLPELTLDGLISDIRPKRDAVLLLLDRIADPGNLGTILRSAAWFGAEAVLIGEGSVDALNPKVVRSSMSALSGLRFVQEVPLPAAMAELKKLGYGLVASSQEGKVDYSLYEFPTRVGIVLGSEATGISDDILLTCDETVFIPRRGKMESLNVAVAASIVLADLMRRRGSRPETK